MSLHKNRKGNILDNIIEMPILVLIMIIVAAVGLYLSNGFDDQVQASDLFGAEAKTVSSKFNTDIETNYPLLPSVIIIAVFLGTLALAWFAEGVDNTFFIFALIIYFFVSIFLSVVRYMYTALSDVDLFSAIISQSLLVRLFFEYLYWFLGIWFVLIWVVYVIRR